MPDFQMCQIHSMEPNPRYPDISCISLGLITKNKYLFLYLCFFMYLCNKQTDSITYEVTNHLQAFKHPPRPLSVRNKCNQLSYGSPFSEHLLQSS